MKVFVYFVINFFAATTMVVDGHMQSVLC